MEMPLWHREWEGEEQSASECVSQPALDTTGSVALTAACQSLGRGSSMCAWGGCYPETVVYMCPCVLSVVAYTYSVCEGCVCGCVDSLCVCVCMPTCIRLRRLCVTHLLSMAACPLCICAWITWRGGVCLL